MGHLNELHEKYAEKGLTILAISQQDKSTVQSFVDELGAKYPTICESSDSMTAYGCTGFPSSFLIDTGGRIVWVGHPSGFTDAVVDEHLARAKILPPWPKALKDVKKAFGKQRFADALAKVEKHAESGKLDEAAQKDAEAIRDWLAWYGESRLEAADQDLEAGNFFTAARALEEIEELYKKHELAQKAAAKLDELLSDPERKLEVKAGEKLEKILAAIQGESPKKALKKLRPLLGKKYAETEAGKRAKTLAEELEKKL